MFTTIYPGWYMGRAVHIHVKVRLFDASGAVTGEATTQLHGRMSAGGALPRRSRFEQPSQKAAAAGMKSRRRGLPTGLRGQRGAGEIPVDCHQREAAAQAGARTTGPNFWQADVQLGTSGYRLAQSAPTHVQPMSDAHATPFHASPRNVGHPPSACASTPQPAWHVDAFVEQTPLALHDSNTGSHASPGRHVVHASLHFFPAHGFGHIAWAAAHVAASFASDAQPGPEHVHPVNGSHVLPFQR